MAREDLLARTFVDLARLGAGNFDPKEMGQLITQRCVDLFDTAAAGVLLAGPDGQPELSASSSTRMRVAELSELQTGEGPCLESYRTGEAIVEPDLHRTRRRWERFEPIALAAGFASVHAIPIQIRGHVVGALNLFRAHTGRLGEADMLAAQALAQAAAITILRQPIGDDSAVTGFSQFALADQILIEQAKGTLAGLAAISVDEALSRIQRYARHHDLQLNDVCQQIVYGRLNLATFRENNLRRRTPN